ncbi:MAG TPA: alpha/beta hydrolase [Solirubrobacterales bacterium]|nr:alpha/beta hydrolase [Solirubrobacterales bacterium]
MLWLLVRAPAGPPLPVRAQRLWFDLVSAINGSRHGLGRAAVDAGGVPAERVDGARAPEAPVILYLHGGAYCLHSPRIYRPLTASLAHGAGATLYALHYRRAPEHPCPAAIEDALAAYRWLLDRGVEPGRIAFAGDSAGGGLSVATAAEARAAGLPMPAALALISPWVDLGLSGDSMRTKARYEVVMRATWLDVSSRMYRDTLPPDDPRCSPLFADLGGLPPTLIQSGSNDILLSDSERLAARLAAAGVETELEVHDGMHHVFQDEPVMLPEAEAALQGICGFLHARWGG